MPVVRANGRNSCAVTNGRPWDGGRVGTIGQRARSTVWRGSRGEDLRHFFRGLGMRWSFTTLFRLFVLMKCLLAPLLSLALST